MTENKQPGYEFTKEVLGRLAKVGLKEPVLRGMAEKYSRKEMDKYVKALLDENLELDEDADNMLRTG